MGRISEKSRRFRTRDQIVNDVAFMLTAPVSDGTKLAVIKNALSVWTEFDGKYGGCPHWTSAALRRFAENRQAGIKKRFNGLRHEHAVPKKVLMDLLLSDPPKSAAQVRELFEKHLLAVVVTKEEDKTLSQFLSSMPPEFSDPGSEHFDDSWLRYRRLQIALSPISPTKEMLRDVARLTELTKGIHVEVDGERA